jgi:hypothetical protein
MAPPTIASAVTSLLYFHQNGRQIKDALRVLDK